jgi:hypothetical protein
MRSSATTVERTTAPVGVIFAVVLHAVVIVATLFTWSHTTLDIDDQAAPIVPVDLVTLGAKTNIAPMVKQQPKEPPKQEDVQPPAPEKAQAAPAAPEEAAPPPPDASAAAVLAKPVPQVVPKTKPQPDQKKDKFDINNIVALLDKRAPAASSAPDAKTGLRNIKGFGAQNAMTMDLVDSLRNQIAQCWSPPVGAPHPEQLIVSFELFLNQDGSVAQPPQLTGSSSSPDAFGRAAEDAARRAIYTCAPYRLPADRYSQWRDITLKFDPRMMVGQ